MRKEVNMLSGSITKGLLAIAVPIMVVNVVQTLFNIIDMTILRMFGNASAVGSAGASSTLIALMTAIAVGLSVGANVVVARHLGRRDRENVAKAVGTALVISFIVGFTLLAIGVLCAELFLGWMNCPPELMADAVLYLRLYFLGVPILMLYNFTASILRATGDSKRPMVFLIIGGIAKVLSTLLFTGVFHMGVEGVAFATIISWSISAGLCGYTLIRRGGSVKVDFQKLRLYKKEALGILAVGIPTGLQQALYSLANVIIAAAVNAAGPDATTGISIANTFDGVLYQICHAPSLAVLSYVSQNVGCGNIKRAKQSILHGIMITTCLGAFFGALSAIFSAQLSSLMSVDPNVIAFSQQKMIIISSTYFVCGINESLVAGLRGMGRPNVPLVATMLFMCALRFVWVYLIYPFVPTLTFLYLVWPVGWVLCILTELPFLFFTIRKLRRRAEAPPPEAVAA